MHASVQTTSCRPGPCAARHRTCRTAAAAAAGSQVPCVLLTSAGPPGEDSGLQELAAQIRQRLQCEALVVVPAAAGPADGGPWRRPAHEPSFDERLRLVARPQPLTYELAGATAADCLLCSADPNGGLLASLALSPVLAVVGIHRGPALSSGIDVNPAVAAARQAALLGLPAVAACLATPTPSAPLRPAVAATARVVERAVGCLRRTGGSWPRPANLPRAHFPFPEAGRWSLGKELPLPKAAAGAGRGEAAWHPDDCWALGEDTSWAGRGGGEDGGSSRGRQAAAAAFADGDLLLAVNVPPTWQEWGGGSWRSQPAFASTRPGVIWHCWQVEAASPAGSSDGGGAPSVSWRQDGADLYGRSLPSSSFGALEAGAFVGQDNTSGVIAAATADKPGQQQQQRWPAGQRRPPAEFVVRRGTLLSDGATAGDVDAVMGGRASVTALQAWPAGHPLSVRDDVLLAALDEDAEGLPAWL